VSARARTSLRPRNQALVSWIIGALVALCMAAFLVSALSVRPAFAGGSLEVQTDITGLARYEQTDGRLIYSGTWSTFSTSGASGGSYRRTNVPGATVMVAFRGTRLDWIATKGRTLGLAEVRVDNGPKLIIDLSRSTVAYQQRVYSTGELSPGLHVVSITWSPLNTGGQYISVDAVEVVGTLVARQRVEDTDPRLEYSPPWTQATGSSYSGASFQYTNRPGASACPRFSGVYVALIAKKSPVYGKVRVILDGTKVFTVDLYSPATLYKQRVWSSGALAPGEHSLQVMWTGLKNASSAKTNINLDAVEVVGELLDPSPRTAGVFDQQEAMVHLRKFAAAIGVRLSGSAAERAAAEYAAQYLASLGYRPEIRPVLLPNGRSSCNVVVVKPGTSSLTLLVGGHIDSKPPSPGGNDNASGAAAVLELARCLKDVALVPTVVFVLFGAEEMVDSNPDHHHYGSRAYVAGLSAMERTELAGMISLDMVGYGNAFHVRTMGKGPRVLSEMVQTQSTKLGLAATYLRDPSLYGYSDHEPFELAGYPAVWVEWRDDPLYHTAGDTYGHCNPSRVKHAGELIASFLRSLGAAELQALRAAVEGR